MNLVSLTEDANGVNKGARHPRKPLCRTRRLSSARRVASKRPRPACAGKFCSSEQGVGQDNPMDPLDLNAVQKRKTVSFFYEGQSEFLVRVAPHASPRSPHQRSH